jgi:hydroxymethylglutaryl-CoA synthase
MSDDSVGISGFSVFVPRLRVRLEDWCAWTGNNWEKTRAVVGNSFRVVGPDHNAYTMAANAALALIDDHDIDPQRVGYLAVGTESGSDNATSAAVIVRGLVDRELIARGRPPLARDIEAPEFKQACLGGMYGLKGALRYVATDGADRVAIVVAADIAEYARGSSGEPTQGAGGVALLVERDPAMLAIDLAAAASASSYRALDFRKPFLRFTEQTPADDGRARDFPVFNGKYSTACYIDETLASMDAFFAKRQGSRVEYLRALGATFMHRPYHRMPVSAWRIAYLFALGADGGEAHDELAGYCAAAGVELDAVLAEMRTSPDLVGGALDGDLVGDAYPLTSKLVKPLSAAQAYQDVVEDKLQLGSPVMKELGNLYSAALMVWVAAGLQEAGAAGTDLSSADILMIGYGSGDASEVMAARTVPGWQQAAAKTNLSAALEGAIDLTREQYEALHDGAAVRDLVPASRAGFVIERIGDRDEADFTDYGVEYYRYASGDRDELRERYAAPAAG